MNREIDKSLLVQRFSRAIETYNREAVAQQQIACRMEEMLVRQLERPCNRVLEIGCGTGFLTRRLVAAIHPERLFLNDICSDMRSCFSDLMKEQCAEFLDGDAEQLEFPSGLDLIVSCSVLQWFARPDNFFKRCHEALAPQGYIAFSTFGNDNLKEVSAVTGTGLTYRSLEEWKQMLLPQYHVITASEERIQMTFDHPLLVLRHLKHTGVTAVARQAWTPGDLQRFCREYERLFTHRNKVKLTYHPIYIIARKRASS